VANRTVHRDVEFAAVVDTAGFLAASVNAFVLAGARLDLPPLVSSRHADRDDSRDDALLSHQHPSDQNRVGILAPKVKERARVLKGAGCAETATSPTPAYGVSRRRLACHMEELGAALEVVFAPAR